MEDVIHLNGSATGLLAMQHGRWWTSIPTTTVLSPLLTTVNPMSDNVFAWNLTTDISNECTCYVSIEDDRCRPITNTGTFSPTLAHRTIVRYLMMN